MGSMPDLAAAPMLPLRWPGTAAGPAEDISKERRVEDGGGAPEETSRRREHDGPPRDELAVDEAAVGASAGDGGLAGDEAGGAQDADTSVAADTAPEVVVRTSTRRRKTATAFWENGKIVVVIPAHVRRADRKELVDWLVRRMLSKRPRAAASDGALEQRAATLADRYVDGVRPRSIRWVTNQGKRWGSCSTQTGDIRLSHRLRSVPDWVLDATIVHELAHLVHADHSPNFYAIADRYPRQKDAIVFLEGYSLGLRTAEP